jgi:nitroimidazol reductase NimA-like FMN-containing flavoprotein (pyridoxamine 5'-phosphate oxidase superfamily)
VKHCGRLFILSFMVTLTDEVRQALTAGRLAHVTTINPDGGPQVSAVWVGLEGDDIGIGHLMGGRKVTNIERDPRVALTVEVDGANPMGMTNYLSVCDHARLVEGVRRNFCSGWRRSTSVRASNSLRWTARHPATSFTSRPNESAALGRGCSRKMRNRSGSVPLMSGDVVPNSVGTYLGGASA